MSSTRVKRAPEETVGEGNCAFNAFALALCTPEFLRQVERNLLAKKSSPDVTFNGFINYVADKLIIKPVWETVKAHLLTMREVNKVALQQLISPYLRKLSIDLAEEKYEEYYQQALPIFMGTYHGYTKEYKRDDIYCRHPFIVEEFDRVNNLSVSDQEKNFMIEAWWLLEGHQRFLNAMRCSGEWAGDLELARLAKYFDCVLEVERDEMVYVIHGDFGYFPRLHGNKAASSIEDSEQYLIMACLTGRDIIRNIDLTTDDERGYLFNVSSWQEVCRRLSVVPNFENVDRFVKEHPDDLNGYLVPNWPRACKDALIARSVIGISRSQQYIFSVAADRAAIHIREIPHYKTVLDICRDNYQIRPLLVLHHRGEDHWENMMALPTFEQVSLMQMGIYGKQVMKRLQDDILRKAEPSLRKSDDRVIKKFG